MPWVFIAVVKESLNSTANQCSEETRTIIYNASLYLEQCIDDSLESIDDWIKLYHDSVNVQYIT